MTSYEQLNQLAELTELFSSLKISPADIRAFDENLLISPEKKIIKIKKKLIIQPDDVDMPSESKDVDITAPMTVDILVPSESKDVDKNLLIPLKKKTIRVKKNKKQPINVTSSIPTHVSIPIQEKQTGWLYIFNSPIMIQDTHKIGMTSRTVEARLAEANIHFTYGVSIPYNCLYARKVENALACEKKIHKILDEFRVNPKYEFFKVPFERIKILFDEIPGEVWVEQKKDTTQIRNSITNFDDHQQIRYKNYIGVYNREEKGIIHNGTVYKSLSKFAQACDPGRKNIDGWKECTYLSESGEWLAANNK